MNQFTCPTCGYKPPDEDYKIKSVKYPKIVSHNKKIGDLVVMNYNGEYSSYDWTETHWCKKCKKQFSFENSSC